MCKLISFTSYVDLISTPTALVNQQLIGSCSSWQISVIPMTWWPKWSGMNVIAPCCWQGLECWNMCHTLLGQAETPFKHWYTVQGVCFFVCFLNNVFTVLFAVHLPSLKAQTHTHTHTRAHRHRHRQSTYPHIAPDPWYNNNNNNNNNMKNERRKTQTNFMCLQIFGF